jgi:hypothetical protein
MRRKIPFFALLFSLLPLAAGARTLTVEELSANPQRYDKKDVTVRGVVDFGPPHTYVLMQSKDAFIRNRADRMSDQEAERTCMRIGKHDALFTNDRDRKRIHGRAVVVQGVFFADMFEGKEGINLGGCQVNKRIIDVYKLLWVGE